MKLYDYYDGNTPLQPAVFFPTAERARAVLVIHAWAGRGDDEHRVAERLASLGFVGIAIDVFGKGVAGDPAGDNSHLVSPWFNDRAALLRRLRASVTFARHLDRVDPDALAAVGYCFGGLCVLDLARGNVDGVAGVVSFHGMLDGNDLPATDPMTASVLFEHGWLDPLGPPEKVLAFADEMTRRGADWQFHAHGRAMHAFTNHGADSPERGMAYDAATDKRSWASATAFLDASLRVGGKRTSGPVG